LTGAEWSQCDRDGETIKALHALCAGRGISLARSAPPNSRSLVVELIGEARSWTLRVDLQSDGTTLPFVLLEPPRGRLPHVGYGGVVCVSDGQGQSIDLEHPAEVAAHTLLAAYDLLEKWAAAGNASDIEFLNELEGYWSGLPDAAFGSAALEIDDCDRLIAAYEDPHPVRSRWFFTERGVQASGSDIRKLEGQRGLYIHLSELPFVPVHPERLTLDFIKAVRAAMSPTQLHLWTSLLEHTKNSAKRTVLLVSVPRQAGGRSLVGAAFTIHRGIVLRHAPVTPLSVRRHTASYMRQRGGATMELCGRHVAVLGCGAIGACVADNLAISGLGKMTLVDADHYSEDNVFRHILSPAYIDTFKASALKHQLERRYPGLVVNDFVGDAEQWFAASSLAGIDGIVVAIGTPAVDRVIGRKLRSAGLSMPVVTTWLEALDLGGHSVRVWTNLPGCLDCLYRDDEGQSALHPRTAFLQANQKVTRNLTGCGSVFVPYGALQARKTALMAAEQMLSALIAGGAPPSYRFWRGDGDKARAQSLRTTTWWAEASNTPEEDAAACAFGLNCRQCRGGT